MASQTDSQNQLAKLFKRKKCYTIEQLSHCLNYSLISIRRFLKVIGYYSSFTHNSKWYTLRSIPSFGKNGIWFCQAIGFCKPVVPPCMRGLSVRLFRYGCIRMLQRQ